MKLKELIKKLQRIDEEAPFDLEVAIDTRIGLYRIDNVDCLYGCDDDECEVVGVSISINEPYEFEE